MPCYGWTMTDRDKALSMAAEARTYKARDPREISDLADTLVIGGKAILNESLPIQYHWIRGVRPGEVNG